MCSALALVVAACQVDTTVTVEVADDGSGTVTVDVALDAEAVEQIPALERQLRTDDLAATGWDVSGPDPDGDGGQSISASKPFASPSALAAVLAEVGPITDARLTRERPFAGVDYEFSATVDLSAGVETFSDDDLADLLLGLPIGRGVEALEDDLGAPLSELTSFEMVVLLPEGDRVARFSQEAVLGEAPIVMTAATSETEPWAIGLRWAAIAAVALLGLLLLVRLVKWIRRRLAGRDASAPDDAPGPEPSTG